MGFSLTKTIQLLGYPQDYGNPYIPIAIGVAAAVDDEDEEHSEPGSTDGLGAAIVKKSQSSRATTIILYI